MKTRAFFVALLAVFALGLGGCATNMKSALPDTGTKLACGVAGGLAMHALTGGASSAWRAVATIVGVGGGSYACDNLGK